ncbi:hypothetical protein [Pseudoalteromonas lipolytica]|uniref:hypothetical protein n=1 Tax=Pseudoalteromonas lipolytica TaxID=570156 RepID=UPI000825034A|nr:hypothetical protein [Pseudoalteromonas lipolytica]
MRLSITMICLLAVVGCSSVSNVLPVGKNQFRVSSEMGGQFPSWSDVKELSINKGIEHCASTGKIMEEISWETHGARGWTPLNAELTFKCVDSD